MNRRPVTIRLPRLTGLAIIGLIAYARYFLRLPWLSASVVYLLLFWIFHCGMTFTAVWFPSVLARLEGDEIDWYQWPNVRIAMLLSVIGAAGFVFGLGLFEGRPPRDTLTWPRGSASTFPSCTESDGC